MLHEKYASQNTNEVVILCNKIESLLRANGISRIKREKLAYPSECDLGHYLLFRATNTRKNIDAAIDKYIAGTNLQEAAELKKTGLESDYYKHLELALRPTEIVAQKPILISTSVTNQKALTDLFKAKKRHPKREQESIGVCSDIPDERCSYVPHRMEKW